MLSILIACALAADAAASRPESWYAAVQEVISGLALGPLRADLTPAAFAGRTRTQALGQQTEQLRAKVMGQLFRSLGTAIRVCPLEDTSKEAIKAVRLELLNRTFVAHWHTVQGECGRHNGFLHVSVPPPKNE